MAEQDFKYHGVPVQWVQWALWIGSLGFFNAVRHVIGFWPALALVAEATLLQFASSVHERAQRQHSLQTIDEVLR